MPLPVETFILIPKVMGEGYQNPSAGQTESKVKYPPPPDSCVNPN